MQKTREATGDEATGELAQPLDNPIWAALTTEQARFAEAVGDAARFPPDVTPLASVRAPRAEAFADLARLIGPGESAGVLTDVSVALPPALTLVDAAPIVQMVHVGPVLEEQDDLEELGPDDAPAMLALANATRPGPFGLRTGKLGTFLGIREGGRLVAMAGQRMRIPGLVEISGVCTDPAYAGRGHAARLTRAQLARIREAGATAFLHVRRENARAIALYERLGFRVRRSFDYRIVRSSAR